jgi:hypothetical protein
MEGGLITPTALIRTGATRGVMSTERQNATARNLVFMVI